MKTGQKMSRDNLRMQLENAGYRAVSQVMEHGEYATRGSLFDLYPMGSTLPFRIDFFDDERNIRTLMLRPSALLPRLMPSSCSPPPQFPFIKMLLNYFGKNWRDNFEVRLDQESIYQQVSKHILPTGIEYWQPLFFAEPLTPLFLVTSLIIHFVLNTRHIEQYADKYWQDIEQRFASRKSIHSVRFYRQQPNLAHYR
ncbi:hypothetical protein PT276_06475 [Orbaceae bacterium ESL0721]|nr:hypothetical protein [Orbaceae bacterium ESL0721]